MMKILRFCIALLLISDYALAQNKRTIDSLQKILGTGITPRQKVDVYNQIAEEYRGSDSSQTVGYTSQAIALAKNINYLAGIADAWYHLGWAIMKKRHHAQAMKHYEQARQIAQKANYPKGVANAYNGFGASYWYQSKLARALVMYEKAAKINTQVGNKKGLAKNLSNAGLIYGKQGNYAKALDTYQKAAKINEQIGNKKDLARNYSNAGTAYRNQGNYPKSLQIHQKSLSIRRQIGDKKGEAASYNNIGIVYQKQGNYAKALDFYQKAARINEQTGDKKEIATSYNNIGIIYKKQGNYPKALELYQKSLKVKKQIGDKKGMASSHNNIGSIYKNMGDAPEALMAYQKSLKVKKQIGDKGGMASSYNNIGNLYRNQGKFVQSQQYIKKGLQLKKEIGDKSGIARSYLSLGELTLAQKQIEVAKEYFKKALALRQQLGEKTLSAEANVSLGIAYYTQKNYAQAQIHLEKGIQATRDPAMIKDAAEYLAKTFAATNEHKKAYEHQVLFKKMADSLLNKKNIRQITRLENKQKLDSLEAVSLKAIQSQQKSKHQADIQEREDKQRLTLVGLSFSAALILVLLFFYRSKQRSNQKLAIKNNQLALVNLLLNENQHRVGNDFVVVYAKIAAIGNAQLTEETQQLVERAKSRTSEALTLQELLRYPFQTGEQSLDRAVIEEKLYTIAHTLYHIHFQETDPYQITIHNEVDSLNKNHFVMISFCVFELVKNACKHAFKNKAANYPASIELSLSKVQEVVTLRMKNNGKGFKPELFDENMEFKFGQHRVSKGMSILRAIATREGGSFNLRTTGVHPDVQEGSYFECTFS